MSSPTSPSSVFRDENPPSLRDRRDDAEAPSAPSRHDPPSLQPAAAYVDVAKLPAATQSQMVCHALRLRPGEELKGALVNFTSTIRIRAGFILSCVGSVREVSLRLAGAERLSVASSSAISPATAPQETTVAIATPIAQQQRDQQPRPEQPMLHTGPNARFELLSLVGTLSLDGVHLHASLGDEEGEVCGGHLVRATIHTTAEIIVGVATSLTFSREMDPATGFKELVVSARHTTSQKEILGGFRKVLAAGIAAGIVLALMQR